MPPSPVLPQSRSPRSPFPALLLLLLFAAPRPARAWGCAGHQIVAFIALAHLSPQLAAEANQILAASLVPLPRIRACPAAGLPLFVQVANWADSVRTPGAAAEHYVNLPLAARQGEFDYAAICADCVTAAIMRYRQQLRTSRDPATRAQALRYLIHLVADVHQPLHAADNHDRGGNCVATRLPGQRRKNNLHADWDSAMLSRAMHGEDPQQFAVRLDREFGGRYAHAHASADPVDWAWQSHALAVRNAYAPLHLRPGCHPQPVSLSPAYISQSDKIIVQQLDRAGQSLAALLAISLPPTPTPPTTDH